MSHATPPMDVVSVIVAVVAVTLGPELAPYVGAYTVLSLGAGIGAMIAVWRKPPSSRASAAALFVTMAIVSVCTAAPVAQIAINYVYDEAPTGWQWVFFPAALGIAAIGHDWQRIGSALLSGLIDGARRVAAQIAGGRRGD